MARSVGIKQLKDQASNLIEEVLKHGRTIVITKNNRDVAQINPISQDPLKKLKDMGLISSAPRLVFADIELKKLKGVRNADKALEALISDRGED